MHVAATPRPLTPRPASLWHVGAGSPGGAAARRGINGPLHSGDHFKTNVISNASAHGQSLLGVHLCFQVAQKTRCKLLTRNIASMRYKVQPLRATPARLLS